MKRKDFFTIIIRYLLLMLIALIIVILGNRIAPGKDCSGCHISGACPGKSDCKME